jgi:hypothetical protein
MYKIYLESFIRFFLSLEESQEARPKTYLESFERFLLSLEESQEVRSKIYLESFVRLLLSLEESQNPGPRQRCVRSFLISQLQPS